MVCRDFRTEDFGDDAAVGEVGERGDLGLNGTGVDLLRFVSGGSCRGCLDGWR